MGNELKERRKKFIRKGTLTSTGVKNIKESNINRALKNKDFFRKAAYCPISKNNCKCWACREVGHYINECKNRKHNELIETLSGLNYFKLSEEETLDIALKNNKKIVEIVLEDEHEESDMKKLVIRWTVV